MIVSQVEYQIEIHFNGEWLLHFKCGGMSAEAAQSQLEFCQRTKKKNTFRIVKETTKTEVLREVVE